MAVLDGPVDLEHPCFAGVDLTPLATLASGRAIGGGMSRHGTHVASVIFGRHDGRVHGLAPCRGLIVPIFSDEERHLSQLDLARAIDPAVEAGAHVSNVSGGQRVPTSEAKDLLARAIRHAGDRNMLIVAAAGNDGCACLHVPAAVASPQWGALAFLTFRTDHDHAHEDERAHSEVHAVADTAEAGPGRPGPARMHRKGEPRGTGERGVGYHPVLCGPQIDARLEQDLAGVHTSFCRRRSRLIYSVTSRRSRASGLGPRTSRGLGLDDRSHVRGESGRRYLAPESRVASGNGSPLGWDRTSARPRSGPSARRPPDRGRRSSGLTHRGLGAPSRRRPMNEREIKDRPVSRALRPAQAAPVRRTAVDKRGWN